MPRPALGTQGAGRPERGPASHLPMATQQHLAHLTCSVRSLREKGTGAPCFWVLKGPCKGNLSGPGGVIPSAHEPGSRPHPGVLPLFICSVHCWTVLILRKFFSTNLPSGKNKAEHETRTSLPDDAAWSCCQAETEHPQGCSSSSAGPALSRAHH